jgi:radical SAM superfamily enzyme YgiQ (UPF0313 family)
MAQGAAQRREPAPLRAPGAILLVSTYELGHRPAGIAWPAAFLARAGYAPAAIDLSVEPLDERRVRAARLVAFSVPMHTALKLALRAAARVRSANPGAVLAFHGLYAPLHAEALRAAGASAILAGECEDDLVALAGAVERGDDLAPWQRAGAGAATLARLAFPVPDGALLPGPERYARLADADGSERLAGYAEATRGCKHLCRHCPIPALYGGRFFAVPVDVVVEDVARQVERGVTHVTFGDPDFLNGPSHARRVAAAVHARFPALTFDFTAKVEHLVRHAADLPALGEAGAIFVVSAVESLSDRVLAKLDKGHTRGDVARAFEACRAAGLALRPSLVPFTPWSTLDDYLDLLETFGREGWLAPLDPVQLSIRLLVPPGSLLLGDAELVTDGYDEAALTHRWRHTDPRMDALQAKVARAVEDAAVRGEPAAATFETVRRLALAAAGRPHAHVPARVAADAGRRAPRLTESWFC